MKDVAVADALITYGWNRISYNVLRSLTDAGVDVVVGDMASRNMSFGSRRKPATFLYDSFYASPERFVDQVCSAIRKHKPRVYLPMHEETFIVARHIERFRELGVEVPVSTFEMLKQVHKKNTLSDLAASAGVPVPRIAHPQSLEDLPAIWDELSDPSGCIVIKLLNTNSAKGVSYARTKQDFVKQYTETVRTMDLAPEAFPVVQEYVSGVGVGVSQLYNHGVLKASFTHLRLREKTHTGGTSTARISFRDPGLEAHSTRLLSGMKWHGVVMTEYKFDPESGQGWLIDINPRFWGSLALAIRSGVDFPLLAYRMARDGDVEPVLDYREGVVVRWLLGDMLATLSSVKHQRSLLPLLKFCTMKQDGFDDFFRDDPLVFVREAGYYLAKMLRTRSVNPTADALLDVDTL